MSQAVMGRSIGTPGGRDTTVGRLSSRARSRLAFGVLVTLAGVLVNLALFRGLNDKQSVVQLARDVPAGAQITSGDFRTVSIGSDGGFRSVSADELSTLVGSYAKVRMVAGTLLSRESLQAIPLVTPGAAVVAVQVAPGEIPIGLRERSTVQVVTIDAAGATSTTAATVVGLPMSADVGGQVSVSLEVAIADAQRIATADDIQIVLLEPEVG